MRHPRPQLGWVEWRRQLPCVCGLRVGQTCEIASRRLGPIRVRYGLRIRPWQRRVNPISCIHPFTDDKDLGNTVR
ncbi:hypothetical protein BHE74_00054802 [Ensete ventricosum]|nr:hypothetical protein GW17_00016544 [Ensete ventricosum]RWW39828.1 hypothetical protein BHE74_00054802 [Ensete ventricosum]